MFGSVGNFLARLTAWRLKAGDDTLDIDTIADGAYVKRSGNRLTGSESQPGGGVPSGGSTGQVLTKLSDDDQDADWANPSSSPLVPSGEWTTATGYEAMDVVTYGGGSYVCVADHTSGETTEPGVGASWETAWQLLAAPGEDGTDGIDGEDGAGVPVGGTAGQVLAKIDGTDHNTEWRSLLGGVGFSVDGGGEAIAAGNVGQYPSFPQAGTISYVKISVDAGTCTVRFWKKAAGTAVPTVDDAINTSGIALSTGTHLKTTTLTDFTTTTVDADDIFGMDIVAVSGVGRLTVELGIARA